MTSNARKSIQKYVMLERMNSEQSRNGTFNLCKKNAKLVETVVHIVNMGIAELYKYRT